MTEHHRNIVHKKFCPKCEHSHFPSDDDNGTGICLRAPPTLFVLGMAPQAHPAIVAPERPQQLAPILRAYYPTVGRNDTCSQFERRAEGEA